jgi:hypothetical protein
MAHLGLQPISNILGSKDTQSLQLWLKRVGASMPDISTVERKIMENQKKQFVPLEMKGRMTKNTYKKQGSSEPDWKGSFMYQGQVLTFGAWENDAGFGIYYNIKLNDPNWKKQQQQYPKEVNSYPKDSDVPF